MEFALESPRARSMKPRPYQDEAKSAVFREWKNVASTLVVQPVGTGKTILFATVINDMQPLRSLVVAERRELIYQARDKITQVTGLQCGIEMGDNYVNGTLWGKTPVVISTIQTQGSAHGDRRRMSRFDPKEFGLLVIDECHHSTAKSYRDLINYYKTNNPNIKILGVTATPDRADEEALGQIFETVAFDYEILDALHDGWLVPVKQQFVSLGALDFSEIRTTCGDLNGADLAAVMEEESNMQGVAAAAINIIGNRRTLVFTASVRQAEVLSNIFNRHQPGMSEWVCGETAEDKRDELLRRFKAGKIQAMVNCNCLSEGYDDPGVEIVIQARPTKSRSLYAQQIGRCMRPTPGVVDGPPTPEQRKAAIAASIKPHCLVVDFVGNSGKHKLMTTADILGGKVSEQVIQRAIEKAKQGAVRMDEALDEAEEEISNAEQRRRDEEAKKAKVVAKVKYATREVSPFDIFEMAPARDRGWHQGKQLTERQKAMLMRNGFNPDKLTFAQGKGLLDEMFRRIDNNLATAKQCALLRRYGYEVKHLTMNDASKLINELAANAWVKPK